MRAIIGSPSATASTAAPPSGTRLRSRRRRSRAPCRHHGRGMRVAVVAEYYPRASDPVLGVWAHRQALAARAAGADVRVLVLHRPVPPRAALQSRDLRAIAAPLRQP